MKKIYNGKVYNTETAEEVAYVGSGNGFSAYYETLFKTKKGNWFLHITGGAFTCMAKKEGNTTFGSEEIQVLTEDEVKKWLMENDKVEEFEKEFKKIEEA